MFGVPIKTRLPLEAWVAAAVVTLISTLYSSMEAPAVSVATDTPPPVEHSADLVKVSVAGDHKPLLGSGYSQ